MSRVVSLQKAMVGSNWVLTSVNLTAPNGGPNFFEDFGVWKAAPILTGSTKFEPSPDVKNIMITGGAGFMYVPPFQQIIPDAIADQLLSSVPAGWYDTWPWHIQMHTILSRSTSLTIALRWITQGRWTTKGISASTMATLQTPPKSWTA